MSNKEPRSVQSGTCDLSSSILCGNPGSKTTSSSDPGFLPMTIRDAQNEKCPPSLKNILGIPSSAATSRIEHVGDDAVGPLFAEKPLDWFLKLLDGGGDRGRGLRRSGGVKVFASDLGGRELESVDSDLVAGADVVVDGVLEDWRVGGGGDHDGDGDSVPGEEPGRVHHGDHVAGYDVREEENS